MAVGCRFQNKRINGALGYDVSASVVQRSAAGFAMSLDVHLKLLSAARLVSVLIVLSFAMTSPATARSSLLKSAKKGDLAKVQELINAGADVYAADSKGNTAIYYAALKGHADVVDTLLAAGADVDAYNGFGSTALHMASYGGHVDVIRSLVRSGADINVVNTPRSSGFANHTRRGPEPSTPLMKAAGAGRLEAVRVLIELGAELPAPRAVAAAKKKRHIEVAELITTQTRLAKAEKKSPGGSGPSKTITFTSDYGRRIAAVVGISRYSKLSNLEGAARDARATAETLRALGFDEVLELYDENATRASILDLLGKQLQEKTSEEDLAFIFFAGHGTTETLPNNNKVGYLLPTNGDPDSAYSTGISMETITELSNRLPAKHVYYAIDACYSGSLAISRGQGSPNRPGQRYQAVQWLTAGTEGQQAIERGGRGLFTTYLLEGMDGEADRNGDGVMTASEIGDYVKSRVSSASKDRQTPMFGTMSGNGEVAIGIGSR